jgi:hypothetical protein
MPFKMHILNSFFILKIDIVLLNVRAYHKQRLNIKRNVAGMYPFLDLLLPTNVEVYYCALNKVRKGILQTRLFIDYELKA